jgi:thiamine biosynthesis protein ThiS
VLQIVVNGEKHELAGPLSLRALLEQLQVDPDMVVVERNREILQALDFDRIQTEAGDVLEIVHFMGGG